MESHFVDTNYLLRFLLKDNPAQQSIVDKLFNEAVEKKVVLVTSLVVFFEVKWVLSDFYKVDKETIVMRFLQLLDMNIFQFEEKQVLKLAVILYKRYGLDLEDCYNIIFYKKNNYDHFATFDKKLLTVLKR